MQEVCYYSNTKLSSSLIGYQLCFSIPQIGVTPGFRVFQTRNGGTQTNTEITAMLSNTFHEFNDQVALRRNSNSLTMCHYRSGVRVVTNVYGYNNGEFYMDFYVYVPTTYMERTRGFLGNFDRNSQNEFYRRDGTEIINPSSLTIFTIYDVECKCFFKNHGILTSNPITPQGELQQIHWQSIFFAQ